MKSPHAAGRRCHRRVSRLVSKHRAAFSRSRKLALEPLEDRMLLAVGPWDGAAKQSSIIIDHHDTDLKVLSQAAIQEAKDELHIAYGHTSHGSQLTTGMTGLVSFINGGGLGLSYPTDFFAWNHGGTDGALDLHDDFASGHDAGHYPDWVDHTRAYLDDPANADVNVVIWAWCGELSWYSETNVATKYLEPMTAMEETYPDVAFVYMTGHLDGTGLTGGLHLRNEQIREYCRAQGKILYDFADIEAYDPDGIYYGDKIPDDGCYYDSDGDGSRDRNWAIDWQNSHTEDVDWYRCYSAHSQPLNANLKAYAAWALWTQIPSRFNDPTEVVGRHLFYNRSAFDGNDPAANAQDDLAVASDKVALRPGETATFANYSSYSLGINGIMVDVAGLADAENLDAGDFELRVGNSNEPSTWPVAPVTPDVAVRSGAGTNGSDRVTLTWGDNAVQKQWLQVTVLATAHTGLEENDVFYFGNAIGESGNSTTDAKVNAFDMLGARDNQRTFAHPAPIDFNYDYDRDARVNAYDMLIARDNQTHFLNALQLITVPDGGAGGAGQPQGLQPLPRETSGPGSTLAWLREFEQAAAKQRSVERDPLFDADPEGIWP